MAGGLWGSRFVVELARSVVIARRGNECDVSVERDRQAFKLPLTQLPPVYLRLCRNGCGFNCARLCDERP
ncbi:hypothetical protein E4U31_006244 [Claviceps sp. LM219 group G6]|nr:hypothetical protein E4U31_006244 [Claviceps sp. LM219 group G6]